MNIIVVSNFFFSLFILVTKQFLHRDPNNWIREREKSCWPSFFSTNSHNLLQIRRGNIFQVQPYKNWQWSSSVIVLFPFFFIFSQVWANSICQQKTLRWVRREIGSGSFNFSRNSASHSVPWEWLGQDQVKVRSLSKNVNIFNLSPSISSLTHPALGSARLEEEYLFCWPCSLWHIYLVIGLWGRALENDCVHSGVRTCFCILYALFQSIMF